MNPLYRLEMKRRSRAAGKSSDGVRAYLRGTIPAAAAYRRGTRGHVAKDGRRRRHDYSRKRGIAYTALLHPDGVPELARDSDTLWQEVERVERRKNALLAHEILLTVPQDIPLVRIIEHIESWIQRECVAAGMVADLAIHTYGMALNPAKEKQAERIAKVRASGIPIYPLEEGDLLRRMPPDHHHAYELPNGRLLVYQPHAHILLTTREIGPNGFGRKVKAWGQKAQLYRWRQSWEKAFNKMLAEAGRRERVHAKGRWQQQADAQSLDGHLPDLEPISRDMVQTIDIGGGHHAGLNGRSPRQKDEATDMSKFEFNERVRALHQLETAAQAKSDATTRDRVELIEAMARVQELLEMGVDLDFRGDGDAWAVGADDRITAADAGLFARHKEVLAEVVAVASRPPREPELDDALREAMVLVNDLQETHAVRFFRTKTDALGFEPEGAVPPDTYRKFAGMHDAILKDLDCQKYAVLWAKGRERLLQQKQQLEVAAREQQELREELSAEKRRAEIAERALEALKSTAAILRKSVDYLVRCLGWIVGGQIRKHPEGKEALSEEYWGILSKLPREVKGSIEIRRVPGIVPERTAPIPSRGDAPGPQPNINGPGRTVGREAWTLPDNVETTATSSRNPTEPVDTTGTSARATQPERKQPER